VAKLPHEAEATTPTQEEMAVTTPISGEAAFARHRIKAVEDGIAEIKSDIKNISDKRHSDFVHLIQAFGGGIVLLVTMMIGAYFIIDGKLEKVDGKFDKLNERLDQLSITATRADVKLEDLLARIPPIPTPAPALPPAQNPK
jgi:hypothetical protein